ncbi:MAG: ABC transporter permease subunit [Myxococcaceae bacterium]
MKRPLFVGLVLLVGLWALSLAGAFLFPGVLQNHCPFGRDVLRPDETVCTLSFGGLWVSLTVGLAAAALATALGLVVAFVSRLVGGTFERWTMRVADSFFSLPDVLVLMLIQAAAQTTGDLHPSLKTPPAPLMVISLALVGWAAPARMLRDRLFTLEQQEFVSAARALGSTRGHLIRIHLWPALKPFLLGIFLSRVPSAILAESTVSFFGIARMEPMSLGRYLGTSYSALIYEGGGRVVGPAWVLLVLVVLGASIASRAASSPSRA